MEGYKYENNCWKIETSNTLIIVTDNLRDRKGRNVTSIQIRPYKFAGENKNIRVGGCENIRVITLKTKKN